MQFRNLKRQYEEYKTEIDEAVNRVLLDANFISGSQVSELESALAEYVGVKHCITCANGTDALQLALMAWGIGEGDAVFVPDFTFFSSGEVVPAAGAVPVFVDIDENTYNISAKCLENAIAEIERQGRLTPRAVVAVDLFGLPAEFDKLREIADKHNMLILEDGAQGFGGSIRGKKACSFGDISTTSFFPAKPLGCYGDGGAIFTDNSEWARLLRSFCVHGKGVDKYDNIRIGMNSRLDTLQAAVLKVKLKHFADRELDMVNDAAGLYGENLCRMDLNEENLSMEGLGREDLLRKSSCKGNLALPSVKEGYCSSWAQYTVRFGDEQTRDGIQRSLKESGIPSMIYYKKPLHRQKAFEKYAEYQVDECKNAEYVCGRVLSLPMGPYIMEEEIKEVSRAVLGFLG